MKVRQFLGFAVYRLTASWLPYWIPGSRRYRSLAAHLAVPTISPRSNINRFARFGPDVTIREHAGLGEHSILSGEVFLGPHVTMGPRCSFITGGHPVPPDGGRFRDMKPTHSRIVVEQDAFIGANVLVLPGVTIGRGAAIGAGAVVVKDVPPGGTAVGNPAQIVKLRVPPPEMGDG